jgi:hypothetical protein
MFDNLIINTPNGARPPVTAFAPGQSPMYRP